MLSRKENHEKERRRKSIGGPTPRFSVVISLYNKELYIRRAIDSVLAQSYSDFELLVIDDGSTDGGAGVVSTYNDDRIRLISQPNRGECAARNRGLAEAAAKYIAFLDADDAWFSDFLQSIDHLIEKYPEAGAFATSYRIVFPGGKQRKVRLWAIPGGPGWEGLIPDYFRCCQNGWSPISSSSVCIPAKTFTEVGMFKEHVKIGGDIDMWVRIAQNFPIAFLNEFHAELFQDAHNRVTDNLFPGRPPLPYEGTVRREIVQGRICGERKASREYFLCIFNYLNAVNCLRVRMPRVSRRWIVRVRPVPKKLRFKVAVITLLGYLPARFGRSVVRFWERFSRR